MKLIVPLKLKTTKITLVLWSSSHKLETVLLCHSLEIIMAFVMLTGKDNHDSSRASFLA